MNLELFRNKQSRWAGRYRIESTRLINYDYSKDGFYFVTICTKNRKMFFGKVVKGRMILNKIGNIVAEEWKKTAKIRKDVFLDEWIIMPNHLHGILVIRNRRDIPAVRDIPALETPRRGVSTVANPTDAPSTGGRKPQWKPGVLGAIINQFKGKCTKRI